MISSSFVIRLCNLESATLAWPIRPLHMHRWVIMSHILVTEIKEMVTCSKISTHIAFWRDTSSEISISLLTPVETQVQSPFVPPNPVSIRQFAWDAICRSKSLRVQQALISSSLTNWALSQTGDMEWACVSGVSANLSSLDHSLVKNSLAAFAMFPGRYQESP